MSPRNWLRKQIERLHALTDSPHSIALGFALGTFLGFLPLFGIKTLLSIALAWIFRSNRIAAIIGVTLHDLLLPFTPLLLRLEYQMGYWLLSRPHQFAPDLELKHPSFSGIFSWNNMVHSGGPLLLGSVLLGLPLGLAGYFAMGGMVRTYRKRRASDAPQFEG